MADIPVRRHHPLHVAPATPPGVINGGGAGPPATINCEPGQARKGAAAAVDSGAGMWLVPTASILCFQSPFLILELAPVGATMLA